MGGSNILPFLGHGVWGVIRGLFQLLLPLGSSCPTSYGDLDICTGYMFITFHGHEKFWLFSLWQLQHLSAYHYRSKNCRDIIGMQSDFSFRITHQTSYYIAYCYSDTRTTSLESLPFNHWALTAPQESEREASLIYAPNHVWQLWDVYLNIHNDATRRICYGYVVSHI